MLTMNMQEVFIWMSWLIIIEIRSIGWLTASSYFEIYARPQNTLLLHNIG